MGAKRGRLTRIVLIASLIAATLLAGATTDAGGATGPVVAQPKANLQVVEGASGLRTILLPVTLSAPSLAPVQVKYATRDGKAAVANFDYVAKSGTLTFAPGVVSQSIPVQVYGDPWLEDFEHFVVRLSNAVGAKLGFRNRKVMIQNDEAPVISVNAAKAIEGQPAGFRTRLRQKYYQALPVTAVTRDGTARAPFDYASTNRAVTFPAGTKGPVMVNVATMGDAVAETRETFSLSVSALGVVADANGSLMDGPIVTLPTTTTTTTTGTGPTTTSSTTTTTTTTPPVIGACPAGTNPTTPQPAAPNSPSTAATLPPPEAVRGGAIYDVIFNDEFGDAAYTASKWSTGMRAGDRTLEGNGELQWYAPANSVVTTDNDGFGTLGVLRQTLMRQAVPSEMYTVRTLSRIYPPSLCPAMYDPTRDNSTSAQNTNPTRTPYQFTSGMVNNAKSFGFKYGYVEARVKMSKGFGLWPALWLRDWRVWEYEMDVFEVFDNQARVFRTGYFWGNGSHHSTEQDGGDLGLATLGFPCRRNVPLPASSANLSTCSLNNAVDLSAGYHTFGFNWTPTKYELYLDGVKRWTSPAGAAIAPRYNHLILNLALGNNAWEHDWTDVPIKPLNPNLFSSSYFPKRTVEWDYVRVWQPRTAINVCTPPNCNA